MGFKNQTRHEGLTVSANRTNLDGVGGQLGTRRRENLNCTARSSEPAKHSAGLVHPTEPHRTGLEPVFSFQNMTLQTLGPTNTQFVTGEIVCWHSLNSNQDHTGVVVAKYNDPQLGERVIVKGKLAYRQVIRVSRLNRPAFGPTLCGPGKIA